MFVFVLIALCAADICAFVFGLIAATELPREVEARFVLALIALCADVILPAVAAVPAVMLAASEVEAARTVAFVLALILVVAEVMSESLARDPEDKVASVRLRVPKFHTCDAVRDPLLVDS